MTRQHFSRRRALNLANSDIVSSDTERLILVDAQDNIVGHLDKLSCHNGVGVLHRAFSLFIFNPRGELLMQQRASNKRLWPLYWSNSCCSHPRERETMDVAVARRCAQELGFTTALTYMYKFEYSAQFDQQGSERELCSVYVGQYDGEPSVNPTEIAAWRWIAPTKLDEELATSPANFTPWFKLEWQRLRSEFNIQNTSILTLENQRPEL